MTTRRSYEACWIRTTYNTSMFIVIPTFKCLPVTVVVVVVVVFNTGISISTDRKDSLRVGRSRDRMPVAGRDSPCPSRLSLGPTRPSIQQIPGLFPGGKAAGRVVDHPPSFSAEVKETVELYLYSPSGPSWPVLRWTLSLPLQNTTFLLALFSISYIVICFVTIIFLLQ
jgi:hypothetical protein